MAQDDERPPHTPVTHDHDFGELACGSGLAKAFRERLAELGVGDQLRSTVRDPSARVDIPSLARMMGHAVQSVEDAPAGALVITVEKRR